MIPACGESPTAATSTTTSTTIAPTTTSTAAVTTTTSTVPELEAAPVDVVARLPNQEALQDGIWAVVMFQQAVDCIPPDADLATASPADCDTPVIFAGGESGELVGEGVPVWLVRSPVLAYAMANGSVTVERLRSLPTLLETTSATYTESADGRLEVTGLLPDGGEYLIEVAEATTIDLPRETTGEMVALPDLTGMWESENHALRIDQGGSYELFELEDDGSTSATDLVGFVAMQDGLLIFPSAAGPPCAGETGVYFGEMVEEVLRLAAVDEPCQFRSTAFGTEWSLSSEG